MADDRVRVCTEHGSRVESYSSGRWLCPSKTGPAGHKAHVVVEAETHLVDPSRFSTVPAAPASPRPAQGSARPEAAAPSKPAPKASSAKTLIRWKGRDGARVLWLHARCVQRASGEAIVLRWSILTGKKTEQGCWATAADEQAARREFEAQVARSKAAGWKDDAIGSTVARLVLRPVPGTAKSKGSDRG